MPSTSNKSEAKKITPRQYLCYNRLGTGCDINTEEYRDYLFTHGTATARETRKMVKELTGFSPLALHDMAPQVHLSNTPNAKDIRTRIKNQVLKGLPFLEKYKDPDKEGGLRALSRQADDYIRSLISDYFPGEDDVQMADEVATCSDVESLVLMAFHDGLDSKIKFEAARKLHLMKLFGEIGNHSKKMVDHDKALKYMTDFFTKRINKLPEGARSGQSYDRYLVSTHGGEELETTKYEILDTRPDSTTLDSNVRVTPMRCRRTVVKDKNGKERVIFFRKHPRDKDEEARLTKLLRYNADIGEKDTDRNGIRLVFDSMEDWDDFFRMMKEELKNEIEEELNEMKKVETDPDRLETIESRLNTLDDSIDIGEGKGSLNGAEPFNGSAECSSTKMKIYKFPMKLTRADGRMHHYEFQVLTPDGYADYLYRKGVSWEEYNVNRFFHKNVDELVFPKRIYPNIDRPKLRKKVLKLARQKLWNGNGNGHSDTSPKPENKEPSGVEEQEG